MSTGPVPNWESIMHKNLQSSDGEPAGNVVAKKRDTIFIESHGDRIHSAIPKSIVASFSGERLFSKTPCRIGAIT